MTIGVYGLGRFGSFWAGLLATQYEVLVCSRSVHQAPAGTRLVSLQELGACNAIFLCSAISAIPETCCTLAPFLTPGQTILDTCSVKVWPLRQMAEWLPAGVNIIGTHPMFGPDSARNGWTGLPVVLCQVAGREGNGPGSIAFWSDCFTGLGLAVQVMAAQDHDREAARTQGLTHMIGRILAQMDCEPSPMATLGYRKLLEIMGQTCNDPWQLFVDLQEKNPYTPEVRQNLRDALDAVFDRLANEHTMESE